MSNKTSIPNSESAAAFAKHKPNATQTTDDDAPQRGAKMPLTARLLIFLFIPSFTGLCGLGISYLQTMQNKNLEEGETPHEVNFDTDFVTPFLLSLAFVIVVGFQTNGFAFGAGDARRKGAFVWPKTRTVQKIRRERVIVDDVDEDDKKKQ